MMKDFLRDSIVFSSSRNLLLGLSLIRNVVIARVLGPSDYGYWVIISLLLTYGDQIHLGLRHAGDRELPYQRGQSNSKLAADMANVIFGSTLVFTSLGFIILCLYAIFMPNQSIALRYGVILAGGIICSDQINRFYLMILRTEKKFVLSSKIETGFELLRTALTCALVFFLQFNGAVIAFLVVSIATTVYLFRLNRGSFIPRLDIILLRRLFSIGFFLFLNGLFYIFIISIDRVYTSFFLSKAELGTYGLAALVAQLPVNSSQAISAVLYPTLSEKFGQENDLSSLYPLFTKVVRAISYLAPFLIACILFLSEFFISWLLPLYSASIPTLVILTFGILFLVLTPIPMAMLMASGRNRSVLITQIITVVVAIPVFIFVREIRPGVDGIAAGMDVVIVIYTLLSVIAVYTAMRFDLKRIVRELTVLLFPCLYSVAIIYALSFWFLQGRSTAVWGSFLDAISKIGIFFAFFLPLFIVTNRTTNLIEQVRNSIRKGGIIG
jgi:O-antigen/teichoic acid export membrane protein